MLNPTLMRCGVMAALLTGGCQPFEAAHDAPREAAGPGGYGLLALPTFAHLLGMTFGVATSPGRRRTPEVARDPASGTYLVTWRDELTGQLGGQLLNDMGLPLLTGLTLTPAGEDAAEPRVTFVPALQQFLVVYTRNAGGATGRDVYAQRLSTAGEPIGQPLPIVRSLGDQTRAAIAFDAARSLLLVAWQDDRSGNPDVLCRAITLAANQVPVLGPERMIGVDAADAAQTRPDVAFSATSNTWVVAWEDARNADLDLVGQRLDEQARPQGPNYYLAKLDQAQRAPRLVWNADRDRFLLAFEDEGEGPSDANIRARQLNGQGLPAQAIADVSLQYGAQRRPRVAYNPATRNYLVTYEEALSGTADVLGRYLADDGTPLAAFEVTHSIAPETGAVVVANPHLSEFCTFFELESGSDVGILGQRADGT